MSLALVAVDAALGGKLPFRRIWSSAIDRPEDSAAEDLGLDLEDAERCAWRDQNKVMEELEEEAQAWSPWPEPSVGAEPAGTAVVPAMEERRDPAGRVVVQIDDDDTPPRTGEVVRLEAKAGSPWRRRRR